MSSNVPEGWILLKKAAAPIGRGMNVRYPKAVGQIALVCGRNSKAIAENRSSKSGRRLFQQNRWGTDLMFLVRGTARLGQQVDEIRGAHPR